VDYALALSASGTSTWECMVGNLKRFGKGMLSVKIAAGNTELTLRAEKVSHTDNIAVIRFTWDNDRFTFAGILSVIGKTPLPPYIKRNPEEIDRERYQTIYSKYDGSVAAPTAGLHFTDYVMEQLAGNHISCHEITLHVGAGTFQPIKTRLIGDHEMHAEYFEVTPALLKQLIDLPGKVICVGTTSVRMLESIYWLGVKTAETRQMPPQDLQLGQWEAYQLPSAYSMKQSFELLLKWMENNGLNETMASTKLMIVPGYRFNTADTLITNFHQPGSTLLLLIAAFIGESWKEVYHYALTHDFRFLSYGDSSLLFNR
jgi:S-adenosylmethionine:tRNA ribosyltransferase-isomerase